MYLNELVEYIYFWDIRSGQCASELMNKWPFTTKMQKLGRISFKETLSIL